MKKKIKKIKKIKGYVISNSMNKTIIVNIFRFIKHKIYNKFIKKNSKIYVHDEFNKCRIGNFIEIKECRPISKKKSWIFNKLIYK